MKIDKKVCLNYIVLALPAFITPLIFILEPLFNLLLDALFTLFFPDIANLIGPFGMPGQRTHGMLILLASNTIAVVYALLMIPISVYVTGIINKAVNRGAKKINLMAVTTILLLILYSAYIFINIFITNMALAYVRMNP